MRAVDRRVGDDGVGQAPAPEGPGLDEPDQRTAPTAPAMASDGAPATSPGARSIPARKLAQAAARAAAASGGGRSTTRRERPRACSRRRPITLERRSDHQWVEVRVAVVE